MSKTKENILRIIGKNRNQLKKFGVKRLALFGSCARNQASATSDIDFLVEFETKSFDAYMGLKELLEGLFSCHVDLVLSNTIKPRLKPIILKGLVNAA